MAPERISVVASSGSGKTTLARRIAAALDLAFVEFHALCHLPGWEPRPDDEFAAAVADATPADGRWVAAGNDRRVTLDGPVWERAVTVVVLDLPRHQVMRQIIGRTVRRSITREELGNGNREPLVDLSRLDIVFLTSHAKADAWLDSLSPH